MSNDLEPGCLALVIESVMGVTTGRIVTCVKTLGEHSLYGTIWEVYSNEDMVTEHGGKGNRAHVPAKWLKKINPDPNVKTTKKELEKTE